MRVHRQFRRAINFHARKFDEGEYGRRITEPKWMLHCSTEIDGSDFAWLERLASAFALRLKQLGELFVKLVQFRRDHHLAIGLVGVTCIILLMIALSFIEVT